MIYMPLYYVFYGISKHIPWDTSHSEHKDWAYHNGHITLGASYIQSYMLYMLF